MSTGQEQGRWLDEPQTVRRIVRGLWLACGLLAAVDLLDLLGLLYHKHPHFSFEKLPGFYALYGFLGSLLVVLAGRLLGRLLRRKESYYEP